MNSCPTLMAIYFQWSSGLALDATQPLRSRALLQLGAPLQLMALSRALMRPMDTAWEWMAKGIYRLDTD